MRRANADQNSASGQMRNESVHTPAQFSFAEVLTSQDIMKQTNEPSSEKRRRGRPKAATVANKRPVGRPPGTGKRQRELLEANLNEGEPPAKKRRPGRPRKDDGHEIPVVVERGRFVSSTRYRQRTVS